MTFPNRERVSYFKGQNLKSFKNEILRLDQMGHQHLSNVFYYIKYLPHPFNDDANYFIALLETLNEKFNGKLLPYQPHPRFVYEIGLLDELKMIVKKGNFTIIIDPDTKKQIGSLAEGEYFEE